MIRSVHTLKSGRALGVAEFGDPASDRVVVFAHAAPGSAEFDPAPVATAAAGVRVIAVERPGYGESELLTDLDAAGAGAAASVDQAAADIAEYLAAIGVAAVSAAGWSAGGRVALALSANYPGLVDRVAVIATPAPEEAVPWVGAENNAMIEPLRQLPVAEAVTSLAATFERFVGARPEPDALMGFVGATDVDAAVLDEPGVRDRLRRMLERSAAQGTTGMAADIVGYTVLDWGFDVAAVASPTLLLYGAADAVVTSAHAEWYAAALPDARIEIVPERGHLVVVPAWERALAFLADG